MQQAQTPAASTLFQYIDRWIDRVGQGRIVAVLLLLAFVLRIFGAIHYAHFTLQPVENRTIAEALAHHQGYANAFRPDSGPTAHTGPFAPLIMAAIFSLFGTGTLLSFLATTTLCTVAVILSYYLLYRCFLRLDVPDKVCLAALAFVCLVPFQLSLESTDLVVWEAGYAIAFLSAILLATLKLDKAPVVPLRSLLLLGAATAFLEVLSPAAGLASAGVLGLLLVRRTRWPIWLLTGGVTLALFIGITTPWKMRNERLLGAPVRTRTSFGLSLAIGFHDGQLTAPTQRQANLQRLAEVHPHHAGDGYRRMLEAGGEAAYSRRLVAEAKQWIARHPVASVRIALRNLWNYYCPPAWFWDRWMDKPPRPVSIFRAILVSLLSLIGLVTLALQVRRRHWMFLYPAVLVTLPALPYVITFPLLRYRYLASSTLIFLAFVGLGMLLARWHGRSGQSGRTMSSGSA